MIDAFEHVVLVIMFCLALMMALFFNACASASPTKTTEYIVTPTYCNVNMPTKPELEEGTNNFSNNFAKVLIYADELEMALHCCRGDKECFTSGNLDK